jgi:hypothetical protein
VKKEMRRITKIFMEVRRDILDLSEGESSCVSPTNMGTVPSGLITENKAAKT